MANGILATGKQGAGVSRTDSDNGKSGLVHQSYQPFGLRPEIPAWRKSSARTIGMGVEVDVHVTRLTFALSASVCNLYL